MGRGAAPLQTSRQIFEHFCSDRQSRGRMFVFSIQDAGK